MHTLSGKDLDVPKLFFQRYHIAMNAKNKKNPVHKAVTKKYQDLVNLVHSKPSLSPELKLKLAKTLNDAKHNNTNLYDSARRWNNFICKGGEYETEDERLGLKKQFTQRKSPIVPFQLRMFLEEQEIWQVRN